MKLVLTGKARDVFKQWDEIYKAVNGTHFFKSVDLERKGERNEI